MEILCRKLMTVFFVLCCSLQNPSGASMVREDVIEPVLQGRQEKYPTPSETAEILASGLLRNAKRKPGSHFYPKVELVFILDSSSSVGMNNFYKVRRFVSELVQEFSVNPSATQVAVVSYGATPRLDFPLNKYVNKECTTKTIQSLRYIGGETALLRALELTSEKVLKKSAGLRTDSKKIIFLITGGRKRSSEQLFALNPHKVTERVLTGNSIFVMAVGSQSDNLDLQDIVNQPIRSHFLRVKTFNDLAVISRDIRGRGERLRCSGNSTVYDECNRKCKCKNGRLTNCYRVRKEFTAMSLEERTRYIRTLKIVSSKEPYRKSYDELTKRHPDFFWKIHVQNFFFPWHRWYILKFENLLRRVDCRVTVPYWHWSRAVVSRQVFRNTHIKDVWFPGEHGLGGNGTDPKSCVADGPFARDKWEVSRWLEYRCLKRAFAEIPELTDDNYVKSLFKFPREKFLCFEYAVRMFLHNDLHNAVGGTMSVDESASAPEFWFHHGFLDKLWSDWQKRGKSFKFQFYKSVKDKMPGSGVYGWPYVNLDNQPGCVRVAYEDSKDFYSSSAAVKTRETSETEDISQDGSVKYVTRRYKRFAIDDDPNGYDYDEDDNYGDDDDNNGDDDDDRETEAEKKLRKSCNMAADGSFTIKGKTFTTSKIPEEEEEVEEDDDDDDDEFV